MSDSIAALRRQIASAGDLHAVVRTMKALAAANIGDYERSVIALADYNHMVSLGLGECFRQATAGHQAATTASPAAGANTPLDAIVFGSDQGLVGPFNDVIAEHAIAHLSQLPGHVQVWSVGERMQARLTESALSVQATYAVPVSVNAITSLVARIQIDMEARSAQRGASHGGQVYLFHNRPLPAALYAPVSQRLLPLDATWQKSLSALPWPGNPLPQVLDHGAATLRALIREYLFISLFRACAESLASENASRLSAMERADRNIQDLLGTLQNRFHRQRQNAIDEELFDVTAGYEALVSP